MSTRERSLAPSIGWMIFQSQRDSLQSKRQARFINQRLLRIDEQFGVSNLPEEISNLLRHKRDRLERTLLQFTSSDLDPPMNPAPPRYTNQSLPSTPHLRQSMQIPASLSVVQSPTTSSRSSSSSYQQHHQASSNFHIEEKKADTTRTTVTATSVLNPDELPSVAMANSVDNIIRKRREIRKTQRGRNLGTSRGNNITRALSRRDRREILLRSLGPIHQQRATTREREARRLIVNRVNDFNLKTNIVTPVSTTGRSTKDVDLLRAAQLRGFDLSVLTNEERELVARVKMIRAEAQSREFERRIRSNNSNIRLTGKEQKEKHRRQAELDEIECARFQHERELQVAADKRTREQKIEFEERQALNTDYFEFNVLLEGTIEKLKDVALYTFPEIGRQSINTGLSELAEQEEEVVNGDDLKWELHNAEEVEVGAFNQKITKVVFDDLTRFKESAARMVDSLSFRPHSTMNDRYADLLEQLSVEHEQIMVKSKLFMTTEGMKLAHVREMARNDFMRRLERKRRKHNSATVDDDGRSGTPAVLRKFGTDNTSTFNDFLAGSKEDTMAQARRDTRRAEITALGL